VLDRHDLTDEQWARLEPLLPDRAPRRGGRWADHRQVINDAVFESPSVANVGRLREHYGVRWLLVDHRVGRPPATLDEIARRRFSVGDFAVYDLTG
jgi:transposase